MITDPKIIIDPLSWRGDILITAVIGTAALAIFLILLVIGCWYSKSKYRQAQRLERRNSIRQSLNSLRSVGTNGGFSELGYRRKAAQMVNIKHTLTKVQRKDSSDFMSFLQSTRSTDTLTKGSDYKKMVNNGSIDSMEKSTYNSSIEDNNSYDIYEAHNPNPSGYTSNSYQNPLMHKPQPAPTSFASKPPNEYTTPGTAFGLAYKNEGFRDNSTFPSAANSTFPSRAESVRESEEQPIIHSPNDAQDDTYTTSDYYNTDTLPLNSTLGMSDDSTLDLKKELDDNRYYEPDKPQLNFLQELKAKIPQTPHVQEEELQMQPTTFMNLPTPPDPPRQKPPADFHANIPPSYTPDYNTVGLAASADPYQPERPRSADILETDSDKVTTPKRMIKTRAKSEALLETNFDYFEPDEPELPSLPLTESSRSKSQPLETAM